MPLTPAENRGRRKDEKVTPIVWCPESTVSCCLHGRMGAGDPQQLTAVLRDQNLHLEDSLSKGSPCAEKVPPPSRWGGPPWVECPPPPVALPCCLYQLGPREEPCGLKGTSYQVEPPRIQRILSPFHSLLLLYIIQFLLLI